ncbi:ATP-binding protein [Veillonellaceae bacterium WCA-693-APC-5D-A]|uniref:ATP-binding protein n=1 Tax=Anaerovibrio slackiae TaxID=2652309 RepID=A0A6I2UJH6_9FIRM|nr:ATP-binding protein [Anaerovibrio slackiae]
MQTKLIERKEYIDFLIRHRDRDVIKVVSGVRRAGKSTLFELYKRYLLANGVTAEQIISINFEDLQYEDLQDYRALHKYVSGKLLPDRMNYIFLDEIQHVEKFEKAVDSLFIKENTDIYLTGLNAYFMSGELATFLSGRYVELRMLPLSFSEYATALPDNMSLQAKYNSYVTDGSFPYIIRLDGRKEDIREYLSGIYNTIIVKDILTRLQVRDIKMLSSIVKYVFANVGSLLSPGKIANAMTSAGRKIDPKTVERYLQGLQDSLIIYQANRYDVRGKELLKVNAKYYVVDMALRSSITGNLGRDMGHILENIVYLELLRRGYKVYVGDIPGGEIDFVAEKNGSLAYFQVALSTLSEDVLERELKPLQMLNDNYPKYLLTMDEYDMEADFAGIRKLNVLQWLERA